MARIHSVKQREHYKPGRHRSYGAFSILFVLTRKAMNSRVHEGCRSVWQLTQNWKQNSHLWSERSNLTKAGTSKQQQLMLYLQPKVPECTIHNAFHFKTPQREQSDNLKATIIARYVPFWTFRDFQGSWGGNYPPHHTYKQSSVYSFKFTDLKKNIFGHYI